MQIKHHKLIILIITTLLLLPIFKTAQAAWPAIAWEVFREIALSTSINIVQALFKEDVKPNEVKHLTRQVHNLKTQLNTYQENRASHSEFNQIKQLIAGLNHVVVTMNQRLSSVEDRVSQLESDLNSVRKSLLNISKADTNASAPLDFSINYIYRANDAGYFKALKENTPLHSGDAYKIIFTPNENCYVYIFQVDSANKLYRLFPMQRFGNNVFNNENPVQAGKTYHIPHQNKSFVLDQQTGTEAIYFMASHQRDVVLENQYQIYSTHQKGQQQLLRTVRQFKGVGRIIEDPNGDSVNWQSEGQNFSVLQHHLQDLCNGCVNILKFQHK